MAILIAAMVLAGGKGTRLKSLTRKTAKPAVSYGAKYRIIDFPLSNCANSGINHVGVLTQYESGELNTYIGDGKNWGLNGVDSLTSVLTPHQTEEGSSWYRGTADAIYENLDWLDRINPSHLLILSGDHIYCTTYDDMLKRHIESKADCTISVIEVPWEEASRFGILETDSKGFITAFKEKPKNPQSNLASMGIYIFDYKTLRAELIADAKNEKSEHDFGGNIIPTMLAEGKRMVSYTFKGYWKDVGTISSLHKANMDLLLSGDPEINLFTVQASNRIYTEDNHATPQIIGPNAKVKDSLINQGAMIYGEVDHSIISSEVVVEEGALVKNSVLMEGAYIGKGAKVINAMCGPKSYIGDGETVEGKEDDIALFSKTK